MRRKNSRSNPLQRGSDGDRRYKWCRCAVCEVVAKCRPTFDFYTAAGDDTGLLRCENCQRKVEVLTGRLRVLLP